MRHEFQATWETGPCLGAILLVDILTDGETIDGVRIVGFKADSLSCEADEAAAKAFVEGLIASDFCDAGALESEDITDMAWEVIHSARITAARDRLWEEAKELRHQRRQEEGGR